MHLVNPSTTLACAPINLRLPPLRDKTLQPVTKKTPLSSTLLRDSDSKMLVEEVMTPSQFSTWGRTQVGSPGSLPTPSPSQSVSVARSTSTPSQTAQKLSKHSNTKYLSPSTISRSQFMHMKPLKSETFTLMSLLLNISLQPAAFLLNFLAAPCISLLASKISASFLHLLLVLYLPDWKRSSFSKVPLDPMFFWQLVRFQGASSGDGQVEVKSERKN